MSPYKLYCVTLLACYQYTAALKLLLNFGQLHHCLLSVISYQLGAVYDQPGLIKLKKTGSMLIPLHYIHCNRIACKLNKKDTNSVMYLSNMFLYVIVTKINEYDTLCMLS